MAAEIERRFVVESIDPEFHRLGLEKVEIEQGYYSTLPGTSLRIRIKNGEKAVITHKRGEGMVRDEIETELPLESARAQLEHACSYRLKKTRYLAGRFEIDQFHGPLAGLVIAEIELGSADEPLPAFPDFIHKTREVTSSIDNLALAEFSTFLEGKDSEHPVRELIKEPVPIVVLTGGPASGKTTAIEQLKKDFGDKIVFLPEMATVIIHQLQISPPQPDDAVATAHFQRTLYRAQRITEAAAQREALALGKKLVLTDRGTLDNAAYLPNNLEDLAKICGISAVQESRRYARVIALRPPPQDVFERVKGNNPARRESYAQAKQLGELMPQMWRYHHDRIYSPRPGLGWDAIYAEIRAMVADAIK